MGLFDKKFCSVCGNKIGLLGNRKLEDGNLCKDCAKKLSVWFDDRRNSTVEQIKEQLAYREANKEAVAAFHTTRTIGRSAKVLLDEDARKFMVTGTKFREDDNPDVIDFSSVTGVDVDVQENRSEEMRSVPDGNGSREVSYNPPHYNYQYRFHIKISLNGNPYFDDMDFDLNSSYVEIETVGPIGSGAFGSDPRTVNADYQEYQQMGNEIKTALLSARDSIREQAAKAAEPQMAVKCPSCGGIGMPDAHGCCEYCGAPLN